MSEQKKKERCTEKLMSLKNRISSLKKNTEGDWRKFHLIKISWTHVIQTWTRIPAKKCIDISHFSPDDMNLYIQKMKSLPSCKSSYQALPKEFREEFSNEIKKENYKADNISIRTRITGKKTAESFNRIYSDQCEREALPSVLDKYKKSLGKNVGL